MKNLIAALIALVLTTAVNAADLVSVASTFTEDYVRAKVESVASPRPINEPITITVSGSAPVEIFWFRFNPAFPWGMEEILASRGDITFTPTRSGWYNVAVQNTHFGLAPLPYGIKYLGGSQFAFAVPTSFYQASGWFFVP